MNQHVFLLLKMDDPESKSKWEVQEYSKEDEDEDEATVVRWILTIGREMVITGITVSSAQLALPPLVVFSAMGASFGVLYASYACTTKILSLLLPIPPSPPMPMLLENFQRVDCELEEGYVTDHEEGINELGVETEIVFQLDDYYTQHGQSLIVNADEMEMEDNILQRENVTGREPMEDVKEAIETKPSFEDGDHSLEEEQKGNELLVESPVSGSASNVVFGDVEDVESASDVVFGYTKDVESASNVVYEATKLVTFEEIDSQKPVEVGNKNDERVIEIHHTVVLSDESNLNSSNAYVLDTAAREVIGDAGNDETAIKIDEVVVESSAFKDGNEDTILMTMEEHLLHLNAQVQEISDENLLYERSINNNLENFEDFDGAGDDQGCEEDVGKYLEGDDNGLHEEQKAKEPLVEGWNDKNESNIQEVDEQAKLRDQGWVGNTIENDGVIGGSASIVDLGDVRNVETTKSATVEVIESHKLVEVGNKNEEQLSEMHHTLNLCDENNLNSREVYTLDPVAREVVGGADKRERTIKFDEPVVARSCLSNDGSEDAILRTMEEHLIHSNAEARVIGDERSTNNMGSLEENRSKSRKNSHEGYEEDAGEDIGLEEEQKGKQPLVESWNNDDAKLRDERRVDTEDDHDTVSGSSSDVVLGYVKDVETTKPVTAKHADSQKLEEVGNKTEDHVCELRHTVVLSDENNLSSREVYTLDLAAREVIRDADKDERTIKFDETVVTKSCASTDGSEYTVLRTIEEHLIHSVEDARAIGEESLLDERKTNKLESLEVSYEVKENVVDDNVDAFARSPPSERDIDNGNKVKENAGDDVNVLVRSPSKHETVNAKAVYKKMQSREENLDVDDEKIWEKIRAMKTIVGYNAPSQSTCIGELKALYVFTGVEPPASFEGDLDLDAKLKFLMTIVGVK